MVLGFIKRVLEPVWDAGATPSTSKYTRMADLIFTCNSKIKSWPEASLFPPLAGDKLSCKHMWPEGIQVFEREGKLYIYFRDLEDYVLYIEIREGTEQLSEKREHAAKYLRVMKCKED